MLRLSIYITCIFKENIHATRDLLVSLGFSIYYVKSVFQPAQHITLLGFVLDSRTMSISLTDKRKSVCLNACHNLDSVKGIKLELWHLQSVALLQLSWQLNMVNYSTATWKGVKILL